MNKINLFFILAFKEQTYKYTKKLNQLLEDEKKGIIHQDSTILIHFYMLSKYFNLYNFYEYEDRIMEYANPVIYHIPYGVEDRETGVEILLEKYKGKIPIVMRSYDAHTPLKTSVEYMTQYHDLCFTYLRNCVNDENIIYGHLCYDNHLISKYINVPKRRKFMCMILKKRTENDRFISSAEFKKNGLTLLKTYGEREKIVENGNIDIFGGGWPATLKNYKGVIVPFDQKYHVLNKYNFNIIFENVIVDSYISEKILDAFLTLSIPVYLGSPAVDKYIKDDCFISLLPDDSYNKIIFNLAKILPEEIDCYINNIRKNRDQIFETFSTKENFSKPLYKWYNSKYHTNLGLKDYEYEEIENAIKMLHFTCSNPVLSNFHRYLRLILQRYEDRTKKIQ